MTSVSSLWRWTVASNERAIANARTAATECSGALVERAEVEAFLAGIAPSAAEATTRAVATGR